MNASAPPASPRLTGWVDGIAFGALAVFLLLRPLIPGPPAALSTNGLLDLLPFAAVVAWAGASALRGELTVRHRGVWGALVLLLALIAAAALRGDDKTLAYPMLWDWLAAAAALFVAAQMPPPRARALLWVAAAACAGVVAIGVYQAAGGLADLQARTLAAWNEQKTALPGATGPSRLARDLQGAAQARITTDEIFSTIFPFYSNALAAYLALWIPILTGLWLRLSSRRRWYLAPLIGAALFCLARTGSRGGWMAAAVGLACFVPLVRGISLTRLAALAGAATMPLVLAFWKLPALAPSIRFRLGYWATSWAMIQDHVWTGVGLGNFHLWYNRYRPAWAMDTRFSHNELLQFWAEGGIFLAAALVLCWILWLQRLVPSVQAQSPASQADPRARALPFGIAAGLAALAFHALGDFSLHIHGLLQTALPLAGLGLALSPEARPPLRARLAPAGQFALLLAPFAAFAAWMLLWVQPAISAEPLIAKLETISPDTGPDEIAERLGDLEEARRLLPWNTSLLELEANLLERTGKRVGGAELRHKALEIWEELLIRRPAYPRRPIRTDRLTPDTLAEGLAILELNLALYPASPRAHFERGGTLLAVHDSPELAERFARDSRLPRKEAEAWLQREARRSLERALELDDQTPEERNRLRGKDARWAAEQLKSRQ